MKGSTQSLEDNLKELSILNIRWGVLIKILTEIKSGKGSLRHYGDAANIICDIHSVTEKMMMWARQLAKRDWTCYGIKAYPVESEEKIFLDYTPKDLCDDLGGFVIVNLRAIEILKIIQEAVGAVGGRIIVTGGCFYSARKSERKMKQHREAKCFDFTSTLPIRQLADIIIELGEKGMIPARFYMLRGRYIHFAPARKKFTFFESKTEAMEAFNCRDACNLPKPSSPRQSQKP